MGSVPVRVEPKVVSVKSESAVARRGSRAEAPLTVFLGTGYTPSLAPSGSDPDLGNGDGTGVAS